MMPDRLSDIFNVKDYGAYGDYPKPGYHYDTVAIQAALTAASSKGAGSSLLASPGQGALDRHRAS
jgi:polygalacturonase